MQDVCFAGLDIKNLYNYVPKFAFKWKDIGIQLLNTQHHSALNNIEADHKGNTEECCKRMIAKWLETEQNASWSQLIKALNKKSVSLNALANKIKKFAIGNDLICI